MPGVDWAGLALVSRLEQWLQSHPYLFVVSTAKLLKTPRGAGTTSMPSIRPRDAILDGVPRKELANEPTGVFRMPLPESTKERSPRPLVLPLKKVQITFPSMITIGRTDNNDLVIPDEQVSKFHAFFRVVDTGVQLFDAGSRNGTFVGGVRLRPRSAGTGLRSGDRFSLAAVELRLFDAGDFWAWVRQLDRFV